MYFKDNFSKCYFLFIVYSVRFKPAYKTTFNSEKHSYIADNNSYRGIPNWTLFDKHKE